MQTLKITLEYDGTDFVGWQRQPNGASIQGALEDALGAIEGGPVTVHGAGRTDAGVHALGQVASFSLKATLDAGTLQRALNAVLPPSVRVVRTELAESRFHARFDARSKIYEYRIINAPFVSPFLYRYAWHIVKPLDIESMQEASAMLQGTHDFAAFQAAGAAVSSTERTIHSIEWQGGAGHAHPIVMRIRGTGFLRQMVRSVAGTLVEIGLHRSEVGRMTQILASRDRGQAGPTAPACGLFLVAVEY
jgi:tRNA pseudouridine38-40 synthase